MTTMIAPHPPRAAARLWRAALFAPVDRRTWLATLHIITGGAVASVMIGVLSVIVSLVTVLSVTVILLPLTVGVVLLAVRWATAFQRSRFAAFLGVEIPPVTPPPPAPASTWVPEWLPARRAVALARDRATWRQIGYHLLHTLLGLVAGSVLTGVWALALVSVTIYATAAAAGPPSNGTADFGLFGSWHPPFHDHLALGVITAVGVALLFVTPWLARGLAAGDVALARALLGPSAKEQLERHVENLTVTRAGAVSAADAERRRIERDLHDGAQQRLVSLAMNLGLARATIPDLPDDARRTIEDAHEEAKQALKELRDLVRGLHPAVLDDRGLDAALSGIAARAPFPVRLRVDVEPRCSPTIEAVAFFVISETLTNTAKHAAATTADVEVIRRNERLFITVHDDGRGGAELTGGSGLQGLAQRVAAVDGTFNLSSPAGGPTEIHVELPCES